MSKYTDEKNKLLEEVLGGGADRRNIDLNGQKKDIMMGQDQLNKLINKNMDQINKLSKDNGMTDNDFEVLQKEINKDFGIKVEDIETPIYNKDSKEIFGKIQIELNDIVLGQSDAIKDLVIGFRRPFVVGIDPNKTRNTILLTGPNGTGRHLMINKMALLMKKYDLQHSSSVGHIDMRRYQSSSQEGIFLQDLYVALNGGSEVVVIENFEEGYAPFVRMLSDLVTKGSTILSKRYILKNGQLQESNRGLTSDVIDSLPGNNKMLVFISNKKMSKIKDVFGKAFVDVVADRIKTKVLDQDSLKKILDRALFDFIEKCTNQLEINVQIDESCKDWILRQYDADNGIDSIMPSIRKLYDSLVQVALEYDSVTKVIFKYEDTIVISFSEINYKVDLTNDTQREREAIQKELDKIVGLDEVKNYMYSLEDHIKAATLRKQRGLKVVEVSKHMIFTGNPGTGKTTIARLMARMMKAIGALDQGQLVEVTRADLVGRYVGHTAPLTMSVIQSALGGVLFIDEAYSLYRGKDDSFGLEAIDTLVKAMEDHRDDLIVILAGYSKEMKEFLESNSGLKSRFANIINFSDYSGEELRKIAEVIANSKEYNIEELAKKPLQDYFTLVQISADNKSGNGRLARNMVEDAMLNQSQRILKNPDQDMELLLLKDFKLNEE
jgi:SpoVK/Ycf46/Vps4 family AAA+-type ATPase